MAKISLGTLHKTFPQGTWSSICISETEQWVAPKFWYFLQYFCIIFVNTTIRLVSIREPLSLDIVNKFYLGENSAHLRLLWIRLFSKPIKGRFSRNALIIFDVYLVFLNNSYTAILTYLPFVANIGIPPLTVIAARNSIRWAKCKPFSTVNYVGSIFSNREEELFSLYNFYTVDLQPDLKVDSRENEGYIEPVNAPKFLISECKLFADKNFKKRVAEAKQALELDDLDFLDLEESLLESLESTLDELGSRSVGDEKLYVSYINELNLSKLRFSNELEYEFFSNRQAKFLAAMRSSFYSHDQSGNLIISNQPPQEINSIKFSELMYDGLIQQDNKKIFFKSLVRRHATRSRMFCLKNKIIGLGKYYTNRKFLYLRYKISKSKYKYSSQGVARLYLPSRSTLGIGASKKKIALLKKLYNTNLLKINISLGASVYVTKNKELRFITQLYKWTQRGLLGYSSKLLGLKYSKHTNVNYKSELLISVVDPVSFYDIYNAAVKFQDLYIVKSVETAAARAPQLNFTDSRLYSFNNVKTRLKSYNLLNVYSLLMFSTYGTFRGDFNYRTEYITALASIIFYRVYFYDSQVTCLSMRKIMHRYWSNTAGDLALPLLADTAQEDIFSLELENFFLLTVDSIFMSEIYVNKAYFRSVSSFLALQVLACENKLTVECVIRLISAVKGNFKSTLYDNLREFNFTELLGGPQDSRFIQFFVINFIEEKTFLWETLQKLFKLAFLYLSMDTRELCYYLLNFTDPLTLTSYACDATLTNHMEQYCLLGALTTSCLHYNFFNNFNEFYLGNSICLENSMLTDSVNELEYVERFTTYQKKTIQQYRTLDIF